RRHVCDRAQRRARASDMFLRKSGLSLTGKGWGAEIKLGKTEVKNFGVTTPGDENVSRFDVAMNDALGMCRIERFRHVNGQGEERIELRRTVCQRVLECLAVEILHH